MMSSIQTLTESIRKFLASHHMYVDNEWLDGCVEYLTEDPSHGHTETEIHNLAREQWLLNDLRDICPGSLPPNLKEITKTTLDGQFVLQINSALDIGTPAYQQYLKLQKVNMENVEATIKHDEKIPNHRMMRLHLTDGVQDISAIEYRPMRNLSCDITPGCKILIKGPVLCRRGVLLLSEPAAALLGGEVRELLSTQQLHVQLAARLGVTQNDEPNLNMTTSAPRNDIPTPHTTMPSRSEDPPDRPTDRPPDTTPTRPVAVVTSMQVATAFADDEIDIDQLAAIEAEFSDPGNKRPSDVDIHSREKRARVNDPADYPTECDVFGEDEDYLREMEMKFDTVTNHNRPARVSSEPYVFIKQINDLTSAEKTGRVFKVKGQIMRLLSKLSVGKDGWSLKCTIADGTGCLDVDFTTDVLSKLVGYTPDEMNRIKREMSKDPKLKEKAVAALQKAKEALQVLYCIIEVTILHTPLITALYPFEESHGQSLTKRLEGAGL